METLNVVLESEDFFAEIEVSKLLLFEGSTDNS